MPWGFQGGRHGIKGINMDSRTSLELFLQCNTESRFALAEIKASMNYVIISDQWRKILTSWPTDIV